MQEQVRLSSIINTFGPGSIVDLRDVSVVPLGIDRWLVEGQIPDEIKIKEPRLISTLQSRYNRLEYFVQLKMKESGLNEFSKFRAYPVRVFPQLMFCPKCRRIELENKLRLKRHYGSELKFYQPPYYCKHCYDKNLDDIEFNVKLVPSRYVVVCHDGHLDDFPYSEYVHAESECPSTNKDIRIFFSG
jgi:hypothetical protein